MEIEFLFSITGEKEMRLRDIKLFPDDHRVNDEVGIWHASYVLLVIIPLKGKQTDAKRLEAWVYKNRKLMNTYANNIISRSDPLFFLLLSDAVLCFTFSSILALYFFNFIKFIGMT